MKTFEHFKNNIPKKVQNKIAELAELIKDDYILEYNGMQDVAHGDADIDEISGKPYSGFIPFQDGGFSVRAFYCTNYDFFTEEQEKWQNEIDEENIKSFYEEHNLKYEKDKSGYADIEENHNELLDDFDLWEGENYAESMIEVEIWSDKDEILTRLNLNYKDTPYFRNRYSETLKEKTYTQKEFLKMDNEEIAKYLFTKQN